MKREKISTSPGHADGDDMREAELRARADWSDAPWSEKEVKALLRLLDQARAERGKVLDQLEVAQALQDPSWDNAEVLREERDAAIARAEKSESKATTAIRTGQELADQRDAALEQVRKLRRALLAFKASITFNLDPAAGMVGAWFRVPSEKFPDAVNEHQLYRLMEFALAATAPKDGGT